MAQTIKSEACQYCNSKDNVKFFKNQFGIMTSKCLTPDCQYNQFKKKSSLDALVEQVQNGQDNSEVTQDDLDFRSFRGISIEVSKKFNYRVSEDLMTHEAVYTQDNEGQHRKIRYGQKKFRWVEGEYNTELDWFGQMTWDQ